MNSEFRARVPCSVRFLLCAPLFYAFARTMPARSVCARGSYCNTKLFAILAPWQASQYPPPPPIPAPAHGVLYSTRATLQLDSNYIWTMLLRQTFRNCILGCSSSSRFFRYPLGSFTASRQKRASRTHEESRVWERLAKRMGTHLPPTLQRLNTSRQSFNLSNVKSPQTAKRTHSSFDKSRGGGYI